jgi:hypothetical protein
MRGWRGQIEVKDKVNLAYKDGGVRLDQKYIEEAREHVS